MEARSTDEVAGVSLQDVVLEAGLRVSATVDDVMRLAAAGQLHRRTVGASDRDEVTRSTALWALMTVDSGVREVLSASGLDPIRWAGVITISGTPPPADSPNAAIADAFREALVDYLDSTQAVGTVGTVDVARAIVQSAERTGRDVRGLVESRLRDFVVEPRTLDGALLASQFSGSVRAVREALKREPAVSASRIAQELQVTHREYGDGLFAAVTWPQASDEEVSRDVDAWLALVRGLYDTSAVALTRHQVLDGELLLLGLDHLDATVSQALSANGFLRALQSGAEIQPPEPPSRLLRDGTRWTSDDVADRDCGELGESDHLGRRFLARALAMRLSSLKGTPETFIVHVDGPWGSGKSTLFKLLTCELKSEYLVVEVNAWRDQQVGVQWWTLHNALRRSVVGAARIPALESLALWFGDIRARLAPFLMGLAVILAVIVGGALLADWNLQVGGDVADSIGKILTLAVVGFTGLTALSRYLLPASGRSARGFVEKSANPMDEVQRLFERTLRRAGRPVVFLIDDLDRCEQAYVLEFLEVVQTLVRPALRRGPSPGHVLSGPYAFIAADGQWLRASYESHFDQSRLIPVPGRTLGYLFLEKIFQLQIRLPSVSDKAKTAYYESLLRLNTNSSLPTPDDERRRKNAEALVDGARTGQDINEAAQSALGIQDHRTRTEVLGRAAVRLSEQSVSEGARHELSRFAPVLDANPRSIKLFVNSFGMLQTLRTLEGTRVNTTPLALWTIVEVRWPMLADHLRRHPDDISFAPDNKATPTEMQQLLLSQDVQRVVNNSAWGPLTPTLVRQCTGELSEDAHSIVSVGRVTNA